MTIDGGSVGIPPAEEPSREAESVRDLSGEGSPIGSRLYRRWIAELPADDISRIVWDFTPWMFNAWVGQGDERRRWDMVSWCWDILGEPAQPFGDTPKPGRWREGNATVFGWSWFGFSTESDMNAFAERWDADRAETPPPAEDPQHAGEPREVQRSETTEPNLPTKEKLR